MIRLAFDHFGANLLTEEEREAILNTIMTGPSKDSYREVLGENFTEELFTERQRHFHRMQLGPFATVLDGEYLEYFRELEAKAETPVAEEDYHPSSVSKAGFISLLSPISCETLASLSNEEILAYINEWEDEQRDKDDWFVKYTIDALAKEFQKLFVGSVIPDTGRLRYWFEKREYIERPIYVRAMIEGMQECIKAGSFERLEESLEFCVWVLSRPRSEREDNSVYGDQSRENPNWDRSRDAVGELVRTCTKEEVNVPISARGRLAKLLEMLCTQFDWQLDKEDPDYFGSNDYLTTAINNTRSRALEYLMEFGLWLRKNDPATDLGEVKTIIVKRFALER